MSALTTSDVWVLLLAGIVTLIVGCVALVVWEAIRAPLVEPTVCGDCHGDLVVTTLTCAGRWIAMDCTRCYGTGVE